MPRHLPAPLLVLLLLLAPLGARAEDAPLFFDSPTDVRPLLIGATVPEVDLLDLDGNPVGLRDLVDGRPTVLIFYRGGW